MDIDAYVAAHREQWDRLDTLVRRRGLSGAEADELVELYQRTATDLSVIRSGCPDAALVARLSTLVARARSAVVGSRGPAWRDVARFFVEGFPAALYRSRRWWIAVGVIFGVLGTVIGAWVAGNPRVRASVATEQQIRQLVTEDFEQYYSSGPAAAFAAQVWTNNAWIAAVCLVSGILIVPVLLILWVNAVNIGVVGGLMAAYDRLGLFFGLVTPHGLLELTAVFVAAGAGLQLGWTVIDPGPRRRSAAVAAQGRATVGMALGVAVLLLISGVIEAFVTPSGLPTWARIGIGAAVEAAFLVYVFVLGRRAARAGATGDLERADVADTAPTAA